CVTLTVLDAGWCGVLVGGESTAAPPGDPVFLPAEILQRGPHRRCVEAIGDGDQALLNLLRSLEPKLDVIKRPAAILALDLGGLGLYPAFHLPAFWQRGRLNGGTRACGSRRSLCGLGRARGRI